MFDLRKYSRRAVAKRGLGLGVGLVASLVLQESLAETLAGYQPKTLTQHELAVVKALMSRLIPTDDQTGGAVEACAHVYLDQALAAHHAQHLETYRHALAELGRLVQLKTGAAFESLAPAQMDAVISRMEKGELASGGFTDGGLSLFNLIRRHTLEGFLSDPMYGGNQEFVGWKLIGYNGVQLYYPLEAQQLNGHDGRAQRSIASFGGTPAT